MGYRFSLQTANTIANLAFGKVISCYRDIYSDERCYWEFKDFLDTFDENFFVGYDERLRNSKYDDYFDEWNHHYFRHRKEFYREVIYDIKREFKNSKRGELSHNYDVVADDFPKNRRLIGLLGVLSELMKNCRIKSLLLPKPYMESKSNDSNDDFMMSKETLTRLLKLHPYDSCLILQPKERPNSNGLTIFDSFPHFDVALRQLDSWSAVMFWNNRDDYVFAPVQSLNELEEMYEIMHYERNDSFGELKRFVNSKRKQQASHYYLHLSDLHFGAKTTPVNGRRLNTLVDKQIESFSKDNVNTTLNFVITGDVVDSPKKKNKVDYQNFYDFINQKSHGSIDPIFVLGNHDINNHGLSLMNTNKNLIDSIGHYPIIQIDNDIKVIFLLFNSNVGGNLAEGEIGTDQLAEMGNNLDKIKNISDYKLVAVLHHHLTAIPDPDWHTKRWFEKLMPTNFLEKSLHLRDADTFKEWLIRRGVKLVLHGHKHIPYIGNDDGINIVACGSSTGQVVNIDPKKTYISYNLLKFNSDTVTCTLYAEDLLGSGAVDVQTSTLKY
ncbi:MAG: metallophosphoesterase [Oscillospiraceae bacterium]|jgi:predicted phosphodiesterase|nr:metallophosphoesterase [Oscillospiraceae bacterium]